MTTQTLAEKFKVLLQILEEGGNIVQVDGAEGNSKEVTVEVAAHNYLDLTMTKPQYLKLNQWKIRKPLQVKPKKGQSYWFVDGYADVHQCNWCDCDANESPCTLR